MSDARRIEENAHDELRSAIRNAALAQWDRQIGQDIDGSDVLVETRSEVETGVLVDYVVMAVFDAGAGSHTVSAVLRTDGNCAQYRTVGLLQQALADVIG